MECRICGYDNNRGDAICSLCNAPLKSPVSPSAEADAGDPAPDWRKEVAKKVKAYGERKKKLITPPYPPNENQDPQPLTEPAKPEPEKEPIRVLRPAERPRVVEVNAGPPDLLEIWAGDLNNEGEPAGEEPILEQLYLGRRTLALLVDSLLLVVLNFFLFLVLSYWIGEIQVLMRHQPWTVLSIVLICHGLYYVSFYASSRQTPGQLFFSLELRAGSSSYIPLSRILLRWGLFWTLHLLNLLPLMFGRKYLYLDLISGTAIRSLRD